MAKVYKAIISASDKFVPNAFRPLWEHPAGPKTIFFWAPAFKWALVMASLDDFRRPLEKVSTTQSGSLAATGFIWTRYCLVIVPINYSLSLCNFMLGLANGVQCFRAYRYQQKIKTDKEA
ncbi:mitochondrial pyruvate carrier 2-like isoform X1 [Hyposmocoma kahamanoa]|uniref:mitochondrial pyruvate carrier 2-like isoform X1 n=1 Tax=Hyposmocoma kahamanoa TaxID=1477025 RepID=UPI000E6D9F08|nr:mitochondrial pyruvate carrier 2-like isoform X1 [Hyposmocoma kahamanoa]